MAKKNSVVIYRRKRNGKTNYKRRLALLKSMEKRLVIRKSVDNISVQIIEYHADGDKVVASAHSRELARLGWKLSRTSIPAAYLTGLMIGKKATKKKVLKVVSDFGFHRSTNGSRLYAVLKGVKDSGLDVSVPDEKLPTEDRIKGDHIKNYAEKLKKESKELFEKQFSGYLKAKIDPTSIGTLVDEFKKKITG